MKIFYCLMIAGYATFCQAQKLQPPTRTRIPWRYSTPNSLTVLWRGRRQCVSYNVELLDRFTINPIRSFSGVTNTNMTFTGLSEQTIYGARVQCVNSAGVTSVFGRPGRSRTIGTSTTMTPITVTGTPPTGTCGKGSYTCLDDSSCIPEGDWCNMQKECEGGDDEKNCPGACEEITEFHSHGNFSCSLFNSPWSACFFQCDEDFTLEGPWYTVCQDRKWTREIPTCILDRPNLLFEGITSTSFRVLFSALEDITEYRIVSLRRGQRFIDPGDVDFILSSGIIEATLTGLASGRYEIVIAGVDSDGNLGMPATGTVRLE